jgi:uncharacterized RDD family membrane protein YckC
MITDDFAYAEQQDAILTHGVMWRRFVAWIIDGILIGLLLTAAWSVCLAIGIVTLGFGFPIFGVLPAIPLLYHWLTLSSPMSASPGQAVMGLTVRNDEDLLPPTPFEALAFTVLLYLTLALGAIWVLVALFTIRHRTFHDMLSGLVVVRARALTRSPGFGNMGAYPRR